MLGQGPVTKPPSHHSFKEEAKPRFKKMSSKITSRFSHCFLWELFQAILELFIQVLVPVIHPGAQGILQESFQVFLLQLFHKCLQVPGYIDS